MSAALLLALPAPAWATWSVIALDAATGRERAALSGARTLPEREALRSVPLSASWSSARAGSTGPASTSAIADRLGVSAASASAMVKRLAGLGFVSHEPYRGVELTPAGEKVALEVIRHHRLIELYLAEALGMPWDQVHEEAEVLEHAISPELSELIARKLGANGRTNAVYVAAKRGLI